MMDSGVYESVYGELVVGADLRASGLRYGMDVDTLKAILHQKVVRETMHKHHQIKKNADKLKEQWEHGQSITQIAEKTNFPPVMTAWLILERKGTTRSQFRDMLRSPEKIGGRRLRQELSEAVEKDMAYSPEAIRWQVERSKMAEESVRSWLTKKRIAFIDEKEAKEKKHAKTPDFLLGKPMRHGRNEINWVECKASFGDATETQRDYRKQLTHYVEMYGKGMVIYWYGFLENITLDGVTVASREALT